MIFERDGARRSGERRPLTSHVTCCFAFLLIDCKQIDLVISRQTSGAFCKVNQVSPVTMQNSLQTFIESARP